MTFNNYLLYHNFGNFHAVEAAKEKRKSEKKLIKEETEYIRKEGQKTGKGEIIKKCEKERSQEDR